MDGKLLENGVGLSLVEEAVLQRDEQAFAHSYGIDHVERSARTCGR